MRSLKLRVCALLSIAVRCRVAFLSMCSIVKSGEGVSDQTSPESTSEVDETADADEEGHFYDVNFEETIVPRPLEEKDATSAEDRQASGGDAMTNSVEGGSERGSKSDLHFMLERHLQELYSSAHKRARSKLNVTLKIRPVSARIESMFPILGLTRGLVEDHPALRHSYRNVMRSLDRKRREAVSEGSRGQNTFEFVRSALNELDGLMHKTGKLTSDGLHVTTIVAQVSVHCKEVFAVRDLDLDEIIQGDGKERDVTHLVRFEMVVQTPADFESVGDHIVELGRWQITDWDDLLKGNVWFT